MEETPLLENQNLIRQMLLNLGEDPNREGLRKTPERMAKALQFLTKGYEQNPDDVVGEAIFNEECNHMVIVRDIEVYSLCEHHLLPFYGKAHVAYIPDGRVVGLSKLARTVDIIARKPQIQERMTAEIADALMDYLKPKGALVMIEAEHMCMTMRGIKKPGSKTVTMAAKGLFEEDEYKNRFFNLLKL